MTNVKGLLHDSEQLCMTMQNIQRADQIAYRFFTKLTLIVNQARSTVEPVQARVDKWVRVHPSYPADCIIIYNYKFNLETPCSDIFRDHLQIYRSVSSALTSPPFELQVLLAVPELTSNQVLVYQASDSSCVLIEPTT